MRGKIEKLFGSHAFIRADDGRSYFFAPTSLASNGPAFADLRAGARVRFMPMATARGWRADLIHVLRNG